MLFCQEKSRSISAILAGKIKVNTFPRLNRLWPRKSRSISTKIEVNWYVIIVRKIEISTTIFNQSVQRHGQENQSQSVSTLFHPTLTQIICFTHNRVTVKKLRSIGTFRPSPEYLKWNSLQNRPIPLSKGAVIIYSREVQIRKASIPKSITSES